MSGQYAEQQKGDMEHTTAVPSELGASTVDGGAPLRPCPLCQCEALGTEHPAHTHVVATFMPDHPGSYTIECVRCNLGLIADTEEQARAAWNSRVVSPEAASALTTLTKELEDSDAWRTHFTDRAFAAESKVDALMQQIEPYKRDCTRLAAREAALSKELEGLGLKYYAGEYHNDRADALMREKEELREEMVRFRDGLRWYADGHHYDLPDWEDCSGESSNWLFPPLDVTEACWMVDDGGVAQSILNLGHSINPNHVEDDEITLAPAIRALVREQHTHKEDLSDSTEQMNWGD